MLEDIKHMVEWSEAHNHNPIDSLSKKELLWLIEQAEKAEEIERRLENAIFTDYEEPRIRENFPVKHTVKLKVTYGGKMPLASERE